MKAYIPPNGYTVNVTSELQEDSTALDASLRWFMEQFMERERVGDTAYYDEEL